jgi:hypothetical protein
LPQLTSSHDAAFVFDKDDKFISGAKDEASKIDCGKNKK